LAAFAQDQLAGVVEIQGGPSGQYFPLQVFTDSADGATISFKVYDAGAGKVFDLKETVTFQAEGVVAGINAPKLLSYTTPAVAPSNGGGGGAPSGGGSSQVQKSKKGKGKSSSASKSNGGPKKSSTKKSSGGSSKESKGSNSSSKKKLGGSKKSKK
jgi:hypothetical protein